MWDMWRKRKKTYIQFGGKFRKRKIGWKESNLHQSDSRCEKWWLALELWKYVLFGISQSVFAVPQLSGELAQKVMNEALKYQGWKYVYGGSNPNTCFDCSGLKHSGAMEKLVTYRERHKHSLTLPNISHSQQRLGTWYFSILPITLVLM